MTVLVRGDHSAATTMEMGWRVRVRVVPTRHRPRPVTSRWPSEPWQFGVPDHGRSVAAWRDSFPISKGGAVKYLTLTNS